MSKIPADIKQTAGNLATQWYLHEWEQGELLTSLTKAFARALVAERNRTIEAVIKIAVDTLTELELKGDAEYLAAAIRKQVAQPPKAG